MNNKYKKALCKNPICAKSKILAKLKGFTLAEVLITLTIIGVVAALTIPSLLSNVSERSYETKRKGFSTRLAQAVSQMDNLNSYKANRPSDYSGSLSASEYTKEYSSMNFVVEGLSKVLKITNICEFENLTACDFPTTYIYLGDAVSRYPVTKYTLDKATINKDIYLAAGVIDTSGVAIRTKNGESAILYYIPSCVPEQIVEPEKSKYWVKEICAAMIVDLDGAKKGPNALGKDVFYYGILYPDMPYVVSTSHEQQNVSSGMPSYSANPNNSAAGACANFARTGRKAGEFHLPTKEEFYINFLLENFGAVQRWTSSVEGSGPDDYAWSISANGTSRLAARKNSYYVSCFKN